MRRMLVDQSGKQKGILGVGEHKSLQTDRVILVPGPDKEIAHVVKMYRWFVTDGLAISQIAARLNAQGIHTDKANPWNYMTVRQVLTNEKYIGNSVFNRRSYKLKKKHVKNPLEMWVRKEGAFEAIVPRTLFEQAKAIMSARAAKLTDAEMVNCLQTLLNRCGTLSSKLIDSEADIPSAASYRARFGSLSEAYQRVSFFPSRNTQYFSVNRRIRRYIPELIDIIEDILTTNGGRVVKGSALNLLTLNDEFSISLNVFKACSQGHIQMWRPFGQIEPADVSIVARMKACNETAFDFLVLPLFALEDELLEFSLKGPDQFRSFRHENLAFLKKLASRHNAAELVHTQPRTRQH